jgi:glutathione S-transferase
VISRIMPRPDLMPLTGGYRRTPVMQIGADIFCDTQIIIRELEKRFPNPTLFPGGHAGVPWALGMWTDRPFFQSTVALVFGSLGDKVPQDFIEDRSKLRGAKFDVAAMTAAIPQMRDQFRANMDLIETQLDDGRQFLLGGFSLADVNGYMNLWYTRQSMPEIEEITRHLPLTLAWEKRIQALGHGTRSEISTAEALEIGTKSTPQAKSSSDPNDPNGRKPGDVVSIHSDDAWKTDIRGEIVSLSAQHIAIRRQDDRAGEVVAHFPPRGLHDLLGRYGLRHAQFMPADHHPVHLVRTVGEAQVAHVLIHLAERAPLRNAGGTVHLDRLVDDLAGPLRHHGLDHADPDPGFLVAEHVHCFRRFQHHQPHRLDFAACLRDDLEIAAEMGDLLAEGLAGEATRHHQIERLFRLTDRAHAVMDAARSEANL